MHVFRTAQALFLVVLLFTTVLVRAQQPDAEADGGVEQLSESSAEESESPGVSSGLNIENEDLMGRIVSEIHLEIPPTMMERRILRSIKIREGRTFTRRRCRLTIQRLYLRGDVANVVIKASPRPDGTVFVKIRIDPLFSYRDFFLVGNSRFNEDEIRRIVRFVRGNEYREAHLGRVTELLRDEYHEIGYLSVDVEVRVVLDEEENKADLFLTVREGAPYRMRELTVTGNPVFPIKKVLRRLRWRRGRVVRSARIEDGVERLIAYYRDHGYYEARVEDPAFEYDHENHAVDLSIHVEAGRRIRIEYDPEIFSHWERTHRLDRVLEVDRQRRFNRWVVRDLARRLEIYLHSRGYHDAQVTSEPIEETDEEKVIRFTVVVGDRWKIGEITFEGIHYFEQRELVNLLDDPTRFEAQEFETALTHVIGHYNRHGFLAARVTGVTAHKREQERRLDLAVGIEEGTQTIISRISFVGNTVFETEELMGMVTLREGEPFDPFRIPAIRSRILDRYYRQGYIRARVSRRIIPDESGRTAELVFEIHERDQYFFGNVYIRGNRLTQNHVIERELFIESGAPYSYESVFRSEQALMRLGFFRSVKIESITTGYEDENIDLMVRVVERDGGYGSLGLGYNTVDGFESTVELGHRNLAGHGRRVSFFAEGVIHDRHFRLEEHQISISFLWPWIGRIPLDGNLSITDQAQQEALFDSHEMRVVLGVSTMFDRLFFFLRSTRDNLQLIELSRFFRGTLEYSVEQAFITDVDERSAEELDIERGEIVVASLSPQLVRNSQNDAFNPSSGSVNRIAMEWAAPYFGSEVHYFKIMGRSSWYFPLDRLLRPLPESVFAFNVSSGWATSLEEADEVPIYKRFFLGGSNTLRGYNPTQVGPREGRRRDATGGNFMFHVNTDFRIPLLWGVGVLLFFDLGNVYEDYGAFEFEDIRYSAGLGLRYITPVGPLSAEYGFALTRWGETDFGQFYLSVGNAF